MHAYSPDDWKLNYQDMIDMSFNIHENWGSLSENDMDDMKALLTETNPWLLALTFAVSMVHTVFDVLAFKNDVQFWRGRTNFEGVGYLSIHSAIWAISRLLFALLRPPTVVTRHGVLQLLLANRCVHIFAAKRHVVLDSAVRAVWHRD